MIVVLLLLVVATMLVVGAIAFTGSERSAAALQTRADRVEACTRAARNMFLSRVNVLTGNVAGVNLKETVNFDPADPNANLEITTGHFDTSETVTLDTVNRLPDNQVAGASRNVSDLSNRLKTGGFLAGYYNVTATCLDKTSGSAREVEFVVRLGL